MKQFRFFSPLLGNFGLLIACLVATSKLDLKYSGVHMSSPKDYVSFKTNVGSLKTYSGGLFCVYIKPGKLHGHTLALYFIFSSVLKHTIQPSYSRILNGARFGFLHFHGFFRIPLRAISMADWGAILWRIYTHIFYFTNRLLLEQTTSMYIHKYICTYILVLAMWYIM